MMCAVWAAARQRSSGSSWPWPPSPSPDPADDRCRRMAGSAWANRRSCTPTPDSATPCFTSPSRYRWVHSCSLSCTSVSVAAASSPTGSPRTAHGDTQMHGDHRCAASLPSGRRVARRMLDTSSTRDGNDDDPPCRDGGGAAQHIGERKREHHTHRDAPIVADDESVPEGAERHGGGGSCVCSSRPVRRAGAHNLAATVAAPQQCHQDQGVDADRGNEGEQCQIRSRPRAHRRLRLPRTSRMR